MKAGERAYRQIFGETVIERATREALERSVADRIVASVDVGIVRMKKGPPFCVVWGDSTACTKFFETLPEAFTFAKKKLGELVGEFLVPG